MNKQEYNNIIQNTVAQQSIEKDSLQTTREALSNMGVVLPQGDLKQVSNGLATNDYMGWRECTVKEALEYANKGTAVVAINDDQIALVAANEEDNNVAFNSSAVMTLNETTPAFTVADTTFYANSRSGTTNIGVGDLELYNYLQVTGAVTTNNIVGSDDGLFLINKSVAEILSFYGIHQIPWRNNSMINVTNACDDWYIYFYETTNKTIYGLLKMREFEAGSTEEEGVTIVFIEFDAIRMKNLIMHPISANFKQVFSDEFLRVAFDETSDYSEELQEYFSTPQSKGSYSIVNTFIKKLAKTAKNGYVQAPKTYLNLMQQIEELNASYEESMDPEERLNIEVQLYKYNRIPNALAKNNRLAGYNVFEQYRDSNNQVNYRIKINNKNNLSTYEEYALLMPYTANENKNSFAAEVLYHAEKTPNIIGRSRAIRADMILDEDGYSLPSITNNYYDLSSSYVVEQETIHGKQ